MQITEKIQLLGAGLYKDIPGELTLKTMPTATELDYVGSEDFDAIMLDSILPQSVEEKVNFRNLLEIDYQWICRCLRFLNYGYYHTTGTIYCDKCGQTSRGEYRVDLRSIACKPLPPKFTNRLKLSKDEFLDFDQDIILHLPTIQEVINASKDKAFQGSNGRTNREFARICYSVSSIGAENTLNPFEVRMRLQNNLSPADFMILRRRFTELSDYGLRAGGEAECPNCHNKAAAFLALIDERYFRPTLDDLREWKHDRNQRGDKNVSTTPAGNVPKHN